MTKPSVESRTRLDAVLDLSQDALIIADEFGRILDFNASAEATFGYRAAEVIGQDLSILMPEPYRSQHAGYLERYRDTGIKRVVGGFREVTGQRKNGTVFPLYFRLEEIRFEGGRRFVGLIRDQSSQSTLHQELDVSRRRFDDFTRIATEWFWETDEHGRLTFLSDRFFEITEAEPAALLGQMPHAAGFEIDDGLMKQTIADAVERREKMPSHVVSMTKADGQCVYFRVGGMPWFHSDGSYAGYRGAGHDVTELEQRNQELMAVNERLDHKTTELRFLNETLERQGDDLAALAESAEVARANLLAEVEERRQLEERLRDLAMTDALTGAANRRAFLAAAEREYARARRYRLPLAVVAIDIDHFKRINDTFGHAAGDVALQALAATCDDQIRASDYFGRLGGEEFAILLPETDREPAMALAERLRVCVAALRVTAEDAVITMTSSFGVAMLAPGDAEASNLLRRADEALYAAKHGGRNRVALADDETVLAAVP